MLRPDGPWFVYLLRCADSTLYAGIARDVVARLSAHARGKGAKYTRGRGPLVLVAKRRCTSKGEALRLEAAIKRLPRPEKEALADRRRMTSFAKRALGRSQAR